MTQVGSRAPARPRFSGVRFWSQKLVALAAWVGLIGLVGSLALFTLLGVRHMDWFLIAVAVGAGLCARFGRPRAAWSARALVGGLVGVLVVALALARGPSRAELTREGDTLVQALESHRARTGRHPNDLAQADAMPRWNRFGGWRYEPRDAGASFHLWCGEYAQDDFVLSWNPEVGSWDWDT